MSIVTIRLDTESSGNSGVQFRRIFYEDSVTAMGCSPVCLVSVLRSLPSIIVSQFKQSHLLPFQEFYAVVSDPFQIIPSAMDFLYVYLPLRWLLISVLSCDSMS